MAAPLTLFERMEALLACAVEELDKLPDIDGALDGAPPRQFLQPGGQVAWDDCCEDGGQVWVRAVQAWPFDTFPIKTLSLIPCSHQIATQVAVGVIRCVHAQDNQGRPPTAQTLTAEAKQMTCDMAALLRAVECCDEDADDVVVDRWAPLGPLGGCAGGEWTLFWHDPVGCPEPEEEEGESQ